MFFIENEGQAVARTDYWQSVQAQAGYVYLSWNAGCNQVNHLIPTRVLVKGGEITCKILK
ncbi:TPA: hypothetical protein M2R06_005113 [Escherichia coli]|nr:hypothetical protein [Escherichia coli]